MERRPITRRRDLAHHHPVVRRSGTGRWLWTCPCGAGCLPADRPSTGWRTVLVEALLHSASIAP